MRQKWAAIAAAISLLIAAPVAAHASASITTPAPVCSWYGETDQRDVNIGAPDLDAHYWATPLVVNSAESVTITGHYPTARYFSFHAYDSSAQVLDSIYDLQINPDKGSANLYRGRPAADAGDSYTVHVVFAPKPARPAPNTLYVATKGIALLVYRVYVPTNPKSPQGGVAFPQITLNTANGKGLVSEGACSTTPPPFGSAVWTLAAELDYPSFLPTPPVKGATKIPTWTRQFGSALGNEQNAYLATTIAREYGQLLVIHTKAPTFPNNRDGYPNYSGSQLRYWSFCVYDASGQAGYGCAADYDAAIRNGYITYVISDPDVRPQNATAAQGVTWLPWGGIQNGAQVLYRNMLPNADFPYAAESIKTPTQNVAKTMGVYYPSAAYCSSATFARGGWKACFSSK